MITKVALKTIAKPVTRSVDVLPSASYRTIGVKWWGEGAYERETIDGLQTAAKTLSIVKENDLIINKIWVRHGSIAIVGKNVDGCAASGEFPTFEIDGTQALPRWLHWYTKTKEFWDKCSELSQGTSGKNRIKPDLFLTVEIPLPPIEEQCRIVGRIEELAGKIAEARGLRDRSIQECDLLIRSARRSLIGDKPLNNWATLDRYVGSIENGKSPACETRPAEPNEWGVFKVGVVSSGTYNPNQNKALPVSIKPDIRYEVHDGDFLMSRANTTELVGSCAIVTKTRSKLLLSDKVFRFIFNQHEQIDPRYLNHVLKSPALRVQIETAATGTSLSMKNISKQKVFKLLVPFTPLEEQHRIVAYLDELQTKVDTMKRLRQESLKELDALLPAILDKAFKGEL
jgi:type I restriction enzyme, S subunit